MAVDQPIDILSAFEHPPLPIDCVLPSMVAGSVGALVSPGGVGKSMLALQLAAQIAGGPDLLGIGEMPTGQVVYLPAEDPPIALQHRLHALGSHLNQGERQVVTANVLIHPLLNSPRDIMKTDGHERLMRFAEGRRLMLLDTLRRFHREEENASGPMSLLLTRLEDIAAQTGCAIVFLHHANKGAALSGSGDQQQASRGSSVLTDNIRWQAYLSGMTTVDAKHWNVDENQKGYFVRFGLSKVNYGPPFQERWLRRHEGGVFTSAAIERSQSKSKQSENWSNRAKF